VFICVYPWLDSSGFENLAVIARRMLSFPACGELVSREGREENEGTQEQGRRV
jgi:hypothetical protein